MRLFCDVAAFGAAAGEELGVSAWTTIDADRIAAFNRTTEQGRQPCFLRGSDGPDHTVAPPALTLSMLASFGRQVYAVESRRMAVNYGLGRVRFLSEVPSGSRLRGRARLLQCSPITGGVQAVLGFTVEREGAAEPVCVAESIVRILE